MAGDPYAKVSPGQDVTESLTASVWNDFIDSGRAHKNRKHSLTSESSGVYRQGSIIRIRNDSGSNLARGAILGISAPLFLPSDNLNAFQSEVVLKAIIPVTTSLGKFVVLVEPAGIGRIAKAAVAGVCQVKVNIISTAHKCADIVAGNPGNLATLATGGSARLLWQESGTGVKWTVIRFGNRCVV